MTNNSDMNVLWESERLSRINNDLEGLFQAQLNIVQSSKSEDEVISNLKILQNKRRQNHECFKKLIKYVIETNKNPHFLEILLERVISGKLYLEVERVRITEILISLYGSDISKSYGLLNSIPIETFTTISERKKNEILFLTFQLGMGLNRYDECEFILKKVRQSDLTTEERIQFVNCKILLLVANKEYIEASKFYLELIQFDTQIKNIILGSYYGLLSNSLVEKKLIVKNDILNQYMVHKNNNEEMRQIIQAFVSNEIIDFRLIQQIYKILAKYEPELTINEEDMKYSIAEHNFNVIRQFFNKAKLNEIAFLMQLTIDETIEFISRMVNEGFANVKINQQTNVVCFGAKQWKNNIDIILDTIFDVNHLIDMESIE